MILFICGSRTSQSLYGGKTQNSGSLCSRGRGLDHKGSWENFSGDVSILSLDIHHGLCITIVNVHWPGPPKWLLSWCVWAKNSTLTFKSRLTLSSSTWPTGHQPRHPFWEIPGPSRGTLKERSTITQMEKLKRVRMFYLEKWTSPFYKGIVFHSADEQKDSAPPVSAPS